MENRSIYNGNQCSFLIRNMPIDDEGKLGRLRDHLATLLVGVDARLQAIRIENNIREKQEIIHSVIGDTYSALASFEEINRQQRNDQASILSDLGKSIEASYISLGLTDGQEDFLSPSIDEAELVSNALYESGSDLDSKFESIISQLTIAIESEIKVDESMSSEANESLTGESDSDAVRNDGYAHSLVN